MNNAEKATAPSEKILDTHEKITIMLHEYDSLRQEIVNRTNHGFQLTAVGAAFFVLIMQINIGWRFWTAIGISAVSLFIGLWITNSNISHAATRVLEIEKDINNRAGENLLVWETRVNKIRKSRTI